MQECILAKAEISDSYTKGDMIRMTCPYCKQEMQRGYMGGVRYQLWWIPEGKKERETLLGKKAGIALNKTSVIQNNKVEAYYCPNCKKVIIDT